MRSNSIIKNFAYDGLITEEAENYYLVERSFIEGFRKLKEPKHALYSETSPTLEKYDLMKFLHTTDSTFETAGINDAGKFRLVRQAVMYIPYLAQSCFKE